MTAEPFAKLFLANEARAMRTRIDHLVPLSVSMTMVPAANISAAALANIESLLRSGREVLRSALARFLGWLRPPLDSLPRGNVRRGARRFLHARSSVRRVYQRRPSSGSSHRQVRRERP